MKSKFCPKLAKGEILSTLGFLGKRKKNLMMMESFCLKETVAEFRLIFLRQNVVAVFYIDTYEGVINKLRQEYIL